MSIAQEGMTSNATAQDLKKPGTILVMNNDTGVVLRVRPDMLEQESFNFSRIMTPTEVEETQNPKIETLLNQRLYFRVENLLRLLISGCF